MTRKKDKLEPTAEQKLAEELVARVPEGGGWSKVRDGQVANRPIDAAIGVTLAGERDILGPGVGRIQVIRP